MNKINKLNLGGEIYPLGGDASNISLNTGDNLENKIIEIDNNIEEIQNTFWIPDTNSTILYVNVNTGSDDNDGSESAPFKTIKHAIDSIPDYPCRKVVSIYIAEGDYTAEGPIGLKKKYVSIRIQGGYDNSLTGSQYLANADKYVLDSLAITDCPDYVRVFGLKFTGVSGNGSVLYAAYGSYTCEIAGCIIENPSANYGIAGWYGAGLTVSNCSISVKNSAFYFAGKNHALIQTASITGSGNAIGIRAGSGAVICDNGASFPEGFANTYDSITTGSILASKINTTI